MISGHAIESVIKLAIRFVIEVINETGLPIKLFFKV